jgi:L-threonylcarbamoyladenylate synthase
MTIRLHASLDTDLSRAAEALRDGALVALPTETVYGLGANAWDRRALAEVFAAKGRPAFDPLILHTACRDDARALLSLSAEEAERFDALAAAFWPGPLTIVGPKIAEVPDLATSGLPTVAVRVPQPSPIRTVIARAGVPIAAPSANRFGRLSPTTADAVLDQLEGRIPYVLDGGAASVGIESTIVSIAGAAVRVLRLGGTPLDAIAAVVGPLHETLTVGDGPSGTAAPQAPGQLTQHYAPNTPLRVLHDGEPPLDEGVSSRALLVALGPAPAWASAYGQCVCLSDRGDEREAAARLFATLRSLDRAPFVSALDVLLCAERGLGRAINDRLRRAAAPAPVPPDPV